MQILLPPEIKDALRAKESLIITKYGQALYDRAMEGNLSPRHIKMLLGGKVDPQRFDDVL